MMSPVPPVEPEDEPVAPEAEPMVPEAELVVPEAEPMVPEAEPVVPEAEAEPVVPEAEPVVPEGPPVPLVAPAVPVTPRVAVPPLPVSPPAVAPLAEVALDAALPPKVAFPPVSAASRNNGCCSRHPTPVASAIARPKVPVRRQITFRMYGRGPTQPVLLWAPRAGLVGIALGWGTRTGATFIDMSRDRFLARLGALVPPPRVHMVRAYGILARVFAPCSPTTLPARTARAPSYLSFGPVVALRDVLIRRRPRARPSPFRHRRPRQAAPTYLRFRSCFLLNARP